MFDREGKIIDFRATMSIAEKKKYLNLETRGSENLAKSYATMGTADNTKIHNEEVIDILHTDYLDNYNKHKSSYVTIEASTLDEFEFELGSNNKKSVEEERYSRLWARLPKATRIYAKSKFKGNKIVIRKDMLLTAFGEDNFSISQAKLLENVSEKTKGKIRKIEAIWQDTMQVAKGNIVIKTPEVLVGNIWSNLKILMYIGVHPVKGVNLMLTAAKELSRYEADKKELSSLRRDILEGKDVSASTIRDLEQSIRNNTVMPLIEAGLYQSVVEDVSTASDNNRVGAYFTDARNKYVKNETANTAIQYLFLTRETKPYQMLLKATQTSDFYTRYAQYYDALEKANTALDGATTLEEAYSAVLKYTSYEFNKNLVMDETDLKKVKADKSFRVAFEKKAMRDTVDNYMNYEAPMHKYTRYMDAMSAWFFIKYFVRAQKVIKRIVKNNPARIAGDILAQTFITGDTPDILDASIFDRGFSPYNITKAVDNASQAASMKGVEILEAYLP